MAGPCLSVASYLHQSNLFAIPKGPDKPTEPTTDRTSPGRPHTFQHSGGAASRPAGRRSAPSSCSCRARSRSARRQEPPQVPCRAPSQPAPRRWLSPPAPPAQRPSSGGGGPSGAGQGKGPGRPRCRAALTCGSWAALARPPSPTPWLIPAGPLGPAPAPAASPASPRPTRPDPRPARSPGPSAGHPPA